MNDIQQTINDLVAWRDIAGFTPDTLGTVVAIEAALLDALEASGRTPSKLRKLAADVAHLESEIAGARCSNVSGHRE